MTKIQKIYIIKIENESHRNVCYHINYMLKHHKAWREHICGALLLFAQNYYYCNNQGKCYNSHSY